MPPKATKRKTKAAVGDDDDLWEVHGDQSKKRARTSGSRLSESRINEDSGDGGKKGTKQFQSWAEWQKKFNDKEKDDKRQFAGTFKQNIEKKRAAVQQLIDQSSKSLKDAEDERAELFKDACDKTEAITTTFNSQKASPKTRQSSSLFDAGQELLKSCRDLVAIHEQANSKALAQGKNHVNERRTLWKADVEQALKVVVYGAQYGEKVIQCKVDMSGKDETKMQLLTPPPKELSGPGQMALDMHERSIQALATGDSTWGDEVLKYLDKFAGIAALCEHHSEDV